LRFLDRCRRERLRPFDCASWFGNAELTGSFRVYGYNRMRAARRRYSYTGVKHGETEEGAINRCN
jgi:hypothetical protein